MNNWEAVEVGPGYTGGLPTERVWSVYERATVDGQRRLIAFALTKREADLIAHADDLYEFVLEITRIGRVAGGLFISRDGGATWAEQVDWDNLQEQAAALCEGIDHLAEKRGS